MATAQEYVTLSSGARCPVIGLGTYAPLQVKVEERGCCLNFIELWP